MSQIVTKGWSSSSWAVLAVGTAFPDALTASSLAGARDCPVLLTDGGTLSPQAKSQIQRLGVKDVYVVGGEGAVSAAVANQVSELGVTIHRIAGQDRVSTSIEALKEARAAGSTSDVIIVATGDAFADALSIGSWSYLSKSPILLARGGSLSEAALSAIRSDSHVKRIVIVGGEAAVSDSVKTQLGGGYEYERLAGSNRYETSTAIANWTLSHNLTTTNALVATGANFPDALAGAALGGKLRSVLLLEDGSGSAARWLTGKGASVTGGSVLGGTAAVSDSAMAALK
jgi:putative cell wall-binding protein